MAFTAKAGYAGRVRYGSGSTALAGVRKWRISKTAKTADSTHFESTADANNMVHETHTAGTISSTISLEGIFDGDTANTDSLIVPGSSYTLDLLFDRAVSALGYHNVTATCTNFSPSQDIAANATFSAEFLVNGVLPAVSAAS